MNPHVMCWRRTTNRVSYSWRAWALPMFVGSPNILHSPSYCFSSTRPNHLRTSKVAIVTWLTWSIARRRVQGTPSASTGQQRRQALEYLSR
jgi:hypothetical protein